MDVVYHRFQDNGEGCCGYEFRSGTRKGQVCLRPKADHRPSDSVPAKPKPKAKQKTEKKPWKPAKVRAKAEKKKQPKVQTPPVPQDPPEGSSVQVVDSSRNRKKQEPSIGEMPFLGIDGEGATLDDGRHIYTYLCASDERGRVAREVENPREGLSTAECLAFLLHLQSQPRKVGFGFGYDYTMMLRDLHAQHLYKLFRPEQRTRYHCRVCRTDDDKPMVWQEARSFHCPNPKCKSTDIEKHRERAPIVWRIKSDLLQPLKCASEDEYTPVYLDWFHGSLSISAGKKPKRSVMLWDVFRFFNRSFVRSLEDWDVGSKEAWERIAAMKMLRGQFSDVVFEEVKAYCREECKLLAELSRRMVDAHTDVGLELTNLYGSGSSAGALLKKHNIREYKGYKPHEYARKYGTELFTGIMSGYFGGRFEHSRVGPVRTKCFGRDINSAYPYAQHNLPCLNPECGGKWHRVDGPTMLEEVQKGVLAICQYRVHASKAREKVAWGPLPCRDEGGSIAFGVNFSGWAWKDEFLTALAGWPELVEPLCAWIFEPGCDHKPFEFLPVVYRQRLELGASGKGIVLKNAINSCYGKTCQSVGDNPPFADWVWAGNITSRCRAQLLQAICAATDRWNVLGVATDGVYSCEPLDLPDPIDTGTSHTKKALGAWDYEEYAKGLFLVRPGLLYDMEEGEGHMVKGRGVGKKVIMEAREPLLKAYSQWDRVDPDFCVTVHVDRFCGAKSSTSARLGCLQYPHGPPTQYQPPFLDRCDTKWIPPPNLCPECNKPPNRTIYEKSEEYATWKKMAVDLSFNQMPKRDAVIGRRSGPARLRIRDLGGAISEPYNHAVSPEALESILARQRELEDPDPAGDHVQWGE